jgi:hypothetical protein
MKPLYIVEELSARCYAGCSGCFRTFVKGPLDADMTLDTFEAANRNVPRGTMILPQFHGESLLHSLFPIFLERYKELGLRVSMPVSGSAGAKYIPSLVSEKTPVYILIISVDGFSSYSHNIRRGNIDLKRAEAFVEQCISERASRSKPWIAVRWVEGGQSELEFELYLKKWLFEIGVDFILRSRMFNYGSQFNSPTNLVEKRCRALEEGAPVVLFNGDVLLCERVSDREKFVIGNVNKEDWDTILSRREAMFEDTGSPCTLCSAAYLLSGFMGMVYLRHPDNEKQGVPIYCHSDHSQVFYSLTKDWSGINWNLT